MERFTKKMGKENVLELKSDKGVWAFTNESQEKLIVITGDAVDRLARYEDLEEQGRLVVPPVKIGDTVFYKTGTYGTVVGEAKIEEIYYNGDSFAFRVCSKNGVYFDVQMEEVWLTRAEAEAALTPTPASDVPEGE